MVSAGQEAFDSFARSLETGFRNCEIAVKPDDTAWTDVPSKGKRRDTGPRSGAEVRRAPGPRARD